MDIANNGRNGKVEVLNGFSSEPVQRGLEIERFFTRPGVHPFDEIEWELRTALITNEKGKTIFEQKDVEIPKTWSQTATNIVVQKYFHGTLGTSQRERSVKTLINRVARTIRDWGIKDGYFASEEDAETFYQELCHILINQKAAFNSPVWFNVGVEGVERPQCSACFINSVEDTMESILDLCKIEGMIFKFGSGSGVNLSPLRSSKERLSGGGIPSGPVSFMRGYDAFAGVIRSGGRTRRAAKMVLLNIDHPDIAEFINSKAIEEKKAWALIEAGYDGNFNVAGGAYDSVAFQNANHSVRVTDEFMQAVLEDKPWQTIAVTTGQVIDTYKARDLMRMIVESAHICGDPGLQFDTTINAWHTCPNTGRINASNPCSEYLHLDDSACNLASINLMKFRSSEGELDIEAFRHAVAIMILAQDIIVDNSSYPTPKIEKNAKAYRQLGLGYANLGALLMARGLAYDSEEGRAYAGAITALMCGEAYRMSAIIASRISPFEGYARNQEPMLRVIKKHGSYVDKINRSLIPAELWETAKKVWEEAYLLGSEYGYRNSQVTVLAPTGCLVGNSLISTSRGLLRLKSLGNPNGNQWQDVKFNVFTDEGEKPATKFYINGSSPTRILHTKQGYVLQGTPQHQVKVVDPKTMNWVWRRFDQIQPGDIIPMGLNTLIGRSYKVRLPKLENYHGNEDPNTKVPTHMTPELAEVVGYFMGDGSLHKKGLRFCVDSQDIDLLEHIFSLCRDLFGVKPHVFARKGYSEISIHSIPIRRWWKTCGFSKIKPDQDHTGKGYIPHVPDYILQTNDIKIYGAFLRGLFEADGGVNEGMPGLCTASLDFYRDVKIILLSLGIPTSHRELISGLGRKSIYRLRLINQQYNKRFKELIGFISKRKKQAVKEIHDRDSYGKTSDPIFVSEEVLLNGLEDVKLKQSKYRLKKQGYLARQTVQKIYRKTRSEKLGKLLGYFFDVVESNIEGDILPTYDLSVPENVTYTANGFISHNTISFLMDCDTTGVEPDISLVKYKKLVGGGVLKIVNRTVPEALKKLQYTPEQIIAILQYIDQNDTIEGAPELKSEHLPVFDCAFKPLKGVRSIHYNGHVKMMAAVQPFLSGAISKTVNMPHEATPEDIWQVYVDAWKLGLKAIAIYRDGCKRTQPLSTSKESSGSQVLTAESELSFQHPALNPVRRRLPDERKAITHKFSIAGHEGYITVGMYEDGKPGEIFIVMSKEGSTISGLMDAFATAISIALQYGVPLEVLINKFTHMRFEPSGYTGNKQIPIAKSIMDYIFRWLALKFLPTEKVEVEVLESAALKSLSNGTIGSEAPDEERLGALEKQIFQTQSDAPPCSECGCLMVRNGACYKCLNCGATSGCS